MSTEKLTTSNLEKAIKALESNLVDDTAPTHIFVPTPKWHLTKRYRGKGRPRKSDYDYVDYEKVVREISKNK